MTPHKRSRFFTEDIVRRTTSPQEKAIVHRSWHDNEDDFLPPDTRDPLLRPLNKGEFGISFLNTRDRQILPEEGWELVDRNLQAGDIVKRSFESVESGTIVGSKVHVLLSHAITGVSKTSWVDTDELKPNVGIFHGDYVVCDDWVGIVEEIFDEALVEVDGGGFVYAQEQGGILNVGQMDLDGLRTPEHLVKYLATLEKRVEAIVRVTPVVIAVDWLAINQTLDRQDAESRQRPAKFWAGADLKRLVVVKSQSGDWFGIGERVKYKDPAAFVQSGFKPSRHGKGESIVEVDTLVVRETRTTVTVLWQDGTHETLSSKDLIPYLNVDEYDCWPGDYVMWKGEDEKRVAIIQSVNARQRTAEVLWADSSLEQPQKAVVSVLELDPQGASAPIPSGLIGGAYGVRRGNYVFVHNEGATNGAEVPTVPRIGEREEWSRGLAGLTLRAQMSEYGQTLRSQHGSPVSVIEVSGGEDSDVDWFGEIVDLRLNGQIEVLFVNGRSGLVPLQRLTLLPDVELMEDLADGWSDDMSNSEDEHGEIRFTDEIFYDTENGLQPAPSGGDELGEGGWETVSEDDDQSKIDVPDFEMSDVASDHIAVPMDVDEATEMPSESRSAVLTPSSTSLPQSRTSTPALQVPGIPSSTHGDPETPWERFSILSSAPTDHSFYASSTTTTRSKSFLSRLSKEYRALTSSLPETILVRTYEDRTDLLRTMIIGPENTPYEDAPFVIDWHLGDGFPLSPPLAHFLSWTNGNGRVNPNLYEEGKVCLSILGTWSGEVSESWSVKSSLLQAFVSIQGLVLVREPWFCEPSFEKLRGTEEGTVNSRLYSEKAYVLSRGFVRRALEYPPGGLESELRWFYFKKGKLQKVIGDAKQLTKESEELELTVPGGLHPEGGDQDQRAVARLSAGARLLLARTVAKLEEIEVASLKEEVHPSGA